MGSVIVKRTMVGEEEVEGEGEIEGALVGEGSLLTGDGVSIPLIILPVSPNRTPPVSQLPLDVLLTGGPSMHRGHRWRQRNGKVKFYMDQVILVLERKEVIDVRLYM